MLLITPSLRISCMIAKVRTSRLHQNGIVTRNSQKLRLRLGRVAMNQAVGNPSTRVASVVPIARPSVRAKIERCASAHCQVSSKMSCCRNRLSQASPEKIHLTPA